MHITFLGQVLRRSSIQKLPYNFIRFIYRKFIKFRNVNVDWFDLDPRIILHIEKSDFLCTFIDAEAVIATSAFTAEVVNTLSAKKGTKFHLIQGDERYFRDGKDTEQAWKAPTTKIAISTFLQGTVEESSHQKVFVVPNFIDAATFSLQLPIENRKPVISMLYHTQKSKGSGYGIEALKIISREIKDPQFSSQVQR